MPVLVQSVALKSSSYWAVILTNVINLGSGQARSHGRGFAQATIGTLRSDNGDFHENLAEKLTPHPFKPFRGYFKSPSYLKEGNLCWS